MRTVLVIFGTLALGVIFYGFTLPSHWHVERSLTLKAPREQVFPFLANLAKWPDWAVPAGINPEVNDKGMTWGGGTHIDITQTAANERVEYELHYVGVDRPMKGTITLAGATTVTWTEEGDAGRNPIARYFLSRVEHDVGADMEQGLSRLQARLETQ